MSAQRRLWLDWADAHADLSLRWVHIILLVLSCSGSYEVLNVLPSGLYVALIFMAVMLASIDINVSAFNCGYHW